MLGIKNCINVYSDLNPWIDFCITIADSKKFDKAQEIIQAAYDEWFSCDVGETIADYISNALTENNIDHEIYFKDEE